MAAVHAICAVISHNKIMTGRNDQVLTLNVLPELYRPIGSNPRLSRGIHCREVVNVRIIVRTCGLGCLRLVLSYTVEIDDTVTKMDVVAGNPDDAFNQKDVTAIAFFDRLVEDDD